MLKSQSFIFDYDNRQVSIKLCNGKYHKVYLRFKSNYTARFLLNSVDYPTYDSLKAFADRTRHFDKDLYDSFRSIHNNTYPVYYEM